MTSYDLDWLISVDDHVIEPPNVWVDRVPAKYRDGAPRMVRDGDDQCWLYEDKKVPTSGLCAVVGQDEGGVQPESRAVRRDAAGVLRPRRAARGHGPRRHPRVDLLPVVPALLRPALLGGEGQGARARSACRPTTTG